jgi:general L-amino acid transport system permease protein
MTALARRRALDRQALGYQLLVLALIGLGAAWLVLTTQANLARLGVDSGIDFLWRRAGFEINQDLVAFTAASSFGRAFVVALLNTLVLAAAAIAGATVLGVIVGVARLSANPLVARLALVYVELFRNIPALLQIFFWYFVVLRSLPRVQESHALADAVFLNNRGLFLPAIASADWRVLGAAAALGWLLVRVWQGERAHRHAWLRIVLGIALPIIAVAGGVAQCEWEAPQRVRFGFEGGLCITPEFLALTLGLSIYQATYIAEIVRSSFAAIARGQVEAADALGLPRLLTVRVVLLPQALQSMIPPLSTVYLNLFKGTSLAAAIAYPEVVSVFVGTVNNLVGQPVVIMGLTLAVYASISALIALALHLYRERLARRMAR